MCLGAGWSSDRLGTSERAAREKSGLIGRRNQYGRGGRVVWMRDVIALTHSCCRPIRPRPRGRPGVARGFAIDVRVIGSVRPTLLHTPKGVDLTVAGRGERGSQAAQGGLPRTWPFYPAPRNCASRMRVGGLTCWLPRSPFSPRAASEGIRSKNEMGTAQSRRRTVGEIKREGTGRREAETACPKARRPIAIRRGREGAVAVRGGAGRWGAEVRSRIRLRPGVESASTARACPGGARDGTERRVALELGGTATDGGRDSLVTRCSSGANAGRRRSHTQDRRALNPPRPSHL